ncbi:hypothetical protein [Synechococcus sp. MIT S9451]|uniref:hypothetical protein n=1 Tax=Synechococcus sp. MIT S9451 TaxID=3082543 RepID=UPI0039B5A2C2
MLLARSTPLALLLSALGIGVASCSFGGGNALSGKLSLMGEPVQQATINVWRSRGGEDAKLLQTLKSKSDGSFKLALKPEKGSVDYLVAQGGSVNGETADKLTMLTVLDQNTTESVHINELTTVGSVWPNAQLFEGDQLTGSTSALAIGSSQVHNLVNQTSGTFGDTLLNSANLLNSETAVRMNVLSNLLALCGQTSQSTGCTSLLSLTRADNTLAAMISIARQPWNNVAALYQLFESNYPVDQATQLRSSASLPYLLFQPDNFSLSIRLDGGGALALGKLMFDHKGNAWSGANWMPGSQSGVVNSIGGGVTHFGPGGKALSPPITGYNGQGLNGTGWGTGISEKYAWVGTFNNRVGVFSLEDGKALGPATIDQPVGQLQGVGTAGNGDVWIADNTGNHMIHFPGGDYTQGKRISIKGLQAPFGVAIDAQNRVWVSSSFNNKITVFPADSPEQSTAIEVNLGTRGIAVDSTGHVWIAQQTHSPEGALAPGAKIPPGIPANPPQPKTIMQEFAAGAEFYVDNPTLTQSGVAAVISPDLKVVKNDIAKGIAYIPWGVTIDGNDNVWIGNLYGQSLIHICGMQPSTCPEGKSTGDVIHNYQSGVIQITTDVIVDDAGNLWSANNWFDGEVVINKTPNARTSTFPGGQGLVVTYGVAAPVQNPLMGPVRKPD